MPIGKIGQGPHVRIYFQPQSTPGKEEGIIRFCVPSGNRFVVDPSPDAVLHFDHLNEIPDKIRDLFRRKGVRWPPPVGRLATLPLGTRTQSGPPTVPELGVRGIQGSELASTCRNARPEDGCIRGGCAVVEQ